MAALSEQAKENKRRRTREWYRKAKADGTLKKRVKSPAQRSWRPTTERQIAKRKASDRKYEAGKGPTYSSWRAMHKRCRNANHKDFANYGGRGITVCQEWFSYRQFLADMGERPDGRSIDRINVNGNYEKENCRWATASEQARNKRK